MMRFDAVRGGAFPNAIAADRKSGQDVAVLVELGLELSLALADAADDRLLHGRAIR